MTFYGIDPSGKTFTAGTYPPEAPATTFENTPEGIAAFVKTLPDDRTDFLVGVENTGVYSETLCYELHEAEVRLVLLDPGAVYRAFGKGPKTDERDAVKIAEYASRYYDKLVRWQPREAVVEQIRVLLATREQLVRQRTAALNARTSLRRKVVQTPGANAALEAVADHLKVQIEALKAEIERLIGAHPTLALGVSLLLSIPGVGMLLASQMVVLTSGFEDLPGYRKLAHRLGIASHPHQSGTSVRAQRSVTEIRPASDAQAAAPSRAVGADARRSVAAVLRGESGSGEGEAPGAEQPGEPCAARYVRGAEEQRAVPPGPREYLAATLDKS